MHPIFGCIGVYNSLVSNGFVILHLLVEAPLFTGLKAVLDYCCMLVAMVQDPKRPLVPRLEHERRTKKGPAGEGVDIT